MKKKIQNNEKAIWIKKARQNKEIHKDKKRYNSNKQTIREQYKDEEI